MSAEGDGTRDRRLADLLFAIAGMVALGLIAVSLSVSGGVFDSLDAGQATIAEQPGNQWLADNRTGLVGGGSLGAADRNPIGSGVENETNPFASRSGERLFTVETETPTYWRVDGYDRYDNGTWVRTDAYETYDGEIQPRGAFTSVVNRSVRLDRDAAVLPSGWQPAEIAVGLSSDEAVAVSSETGVHTTRADAVEPAYSIESYCYAPDADRLRTAGESYPPSIAERYTQGTDSLSNRTVALSDNLTAEADTPYEAAIAIESGLAEGRGYSLETTHDTGTDPVDAFLFETEAGNGEYMASSMVMLLRAQDIPARYVTGYTPGAQVGNTTEEYEIYEVNAHAWVEVYIPGHGWIPFDPTPASDRLTVENTATDTPAGMAETPIRHACPVSSDDDIGLEDDPDEDTGEADDPDENDGATEDDADGDGGGEDEATGEDDTGETGDGDTGDTGDNGGPDPEQPGEDGPESVEIALDEAEPQPGDTVTVIVTRGNDPIEGAIVRFNDDQVGTTNTSGEIRATIPYSEQLVITARVPIENKIGGDLGDSVTGAVSDAAGVDSTDRHVPIPAGEASTDRYRLYPQVAPNETYENATRTYALPAAMSLQTEPIPLVAGGETTIYAILNDRSLADADVFVNGEQVGQTGTDGTVGVTLPEAYDEPQATVSIRRGELEARETIPVEALAIEPATPRVLALPGQTVEVAVSLGGIPIEDATITANGDQVGSTDANGTATIPVSLRPETTVTATYAGADTTTQVTNQLLFVAGVVAVLIGMIAGSVVVLRRQTSPGERIQAKSAQLLSRLRQWPIHVLFRLRELPSAIGSDGSTRVPSWVVNPRVVGRWLWARRPEAIVAPLMAAIAGILTGVRALLARLWRGDGASDTGGEASAGSAGGDGEDSSQSRSVRRIWAAFVRLVMRRIDPTRTPAEIATAAIDRGLPAGPVTRLTDAFRAVEYGRGDPDRETKAASAAMTEIESQEETETEVTDT